MFEKVGFWRPEDELISSICATRDVFAELESSQSPYMFDFLYSERSMALSVIAVDCR